MNKENVQKLLDTLTSLNDTNYQGAIGFNMGHFYSEVEEKSTDKTKHGCGTVACLAGWCNLITNKEETGTLEFGFPFDNQQYDDIQTVCNNARDWLGLDYPRSYALFYGHVDLKEGEEVISEHDSVLGEISLEEAILTIQNLLETGKVDWGKSLRKSGKITKADKND